eukprot:2286610-Heterocapsa_arctica.AAC.1
MGSNDNQLSAAWQWDSSVLGWIQHESHAYCVKQNYPDKHINDKDGIRAERYRLHESTTDKGVNSSRRTDSLLVSNNDKHYSR